MRIIIGSVAVNVCSAPSFMGHEELVIPMLVLGGSDRMHGKRTLGNFSHCLNDGFIPNDLSNTAVLGSTSGMEGGGLNPRVCLQRMFIGRSTNECSQVPEIVAELNTMGSSYAFYLERSAAPLQDAFIARSRFVSFNRLSEFHSGIDKKMETEQVTPALEVLDAFLTEYGNVPEYEAIYGNYYWSPDFRQRFQDPEQFAVGYAIWIERPGVVRAWTRITYVPK